MASPREHSNTQFVIATDLNPPFDSVPNLIRPVGAGLPAASWRRVPSSRVPSSYPLTRQSEIVTFSVERNRPSPKERFRQMPSSHGEFTEQFDILTLWQQSMSMPSRLVSILSPSIVRLSTPVARIPNQPPCWIVTSRRITLRQFFRAIALLPIL